MKDAALRSKNKAALKKRSRLHILLAEDNLLQIKLITVLFAKYGIIIKVAQNGVEAVEKIKTNDFDLVLMDMEMPAMNGCQATAMVRHELKSKVPIIALSAHAQPCEKEKCLASGMNAYLSKPIEAAVLFSTIFKLTGKTVLAKPITTNFQNSTAVGNKVCNLDYLVGAAHGDEKIINNLVDVFFTETGKELSFLNDAIENTNYTVISDISHKIKSAFSILGISALEPVFKEMEQLSSSTSSISNIAQLSQQVHVIFNQARDEMIPDN